MVNKKKFYAILELFRIWTNNLFAITIFVGLKKLFNKNNNQSNSILFINTGLLGDIIISSLILKNDAKLKNLFSTVYLLFDNRYAELFNEYKGQIKILFLDMNKYRLNLFYRIYFLYKLRKLNLKTSINISFYRRTLDDEITLLSGSTNLIGFDNAPKIPKLFSHYLDSNYTEIINPPTRNHYLDLLNLLERLGVISPNHETLEFKLKKTPSHLTKFLRANKRVICLAPQTSKALKNWNYKNFVELAKELIEKFNALIILLSDKQILDPVLQNNSQIIDLTGKTKLEEASSIISISNLFIGNDSGLFHLAKANKVPRIGIIGGGAVNIVFPYGSSEKEILLYKEMNCFGCHWNCIYEQAHCLQDIRVEDVIDSVRFIFEDEKNEL